MSLGGAYIVYSVNHDTGNQIQGLAFSAPSPELIDKMSVVKVTQSTVMKDNRPNKGGVNDLRLGTMDPRMPCQTCGLDIHECDGHIGHIDLPMPVYHVGYRSVTYRLLRSFCVNCSRALFNPRDPFIESHARTYRHDRERRFLNITASQRKYRQCAHCQCYQPTFSSPPAVQIIANWAPARAAAAKWHAKALKSDPDTPAPVFPALADRTFFPADALAILQNIRHDDLRLLGFDPELSHPAWHILTKLIVSPTCIRPQRHLTGDAKAWGQDDMTYNLRETVRIVEDINKLIERCVAEGQEPPEGLFTLEAELRWHLPDEDELRSQAAEGGPEADLSSEAVERRKRRRADETTERERLHTSAMGRTKSASGPMPKRRRIAPYNARFAMSAHIGKCSQEHAALLALADMLQDQIATSFNDDVRTITPRHGAGGMPRGKVKGIKHRLKGKTGRVRGNMLGKRVDFSARSVVSPDLSLDIGYIGVPAALALVLTYPERVTRFNIEHLQARVNAGFGRLDGAASVVICEGSRKRHIVFETFKGNNNTIRLRYGDVVERYLQDDDIVLFNRQPTLHKFSFQAVRIKIHNDLTFKCNPYMIRPFNGDFDGDEFNIHVPQNEAARAEALVLMYNQVVTAKNSSPTYAMMLDGVTGFFGITSRDTFMSEHDARTMIAAVTHRTDAHQRDLELPIPAILKPVPLWTGKQLFSWLLPRFTYYARSVRDFSGGASGDAVRDDHLERHVTIDDGELLTGRLCSKTLGTAHGGLMHQVLRDHGVERFNKLIRNMQDMNTVYMNTQGFSIGIGDVTLPEHLRGWVEHAMVRGDEAVREFLAFPDLHKLLRPEQIEAHVHALSNSLLQAVGGTVQNSVTAHDSSLIHMVLAGAKGTFVTAAQMMGYVGQQSVQGRRLMPERGRLLPHSEMDDGGLSSRGFGKSCFRRGLTMSDMYGASMSAIESLVDTAVKTSIIGYLQRTLSCMMQTKMVRTDGTVRDSSNRIVCNVYGGDGFAAERLEMTRLTALRADLHAVPCGWPDAAAMPTDVCPTRMCAATAAYSPKSWALCSTFVLRRQRALRDAIVAARLLANPFDLNNTAYLPLNIGRLMDEEEHRAAQARRHRALGALGVDGTSDDVLVTPARALKMVRELVRHVRASLPLNAGWSCLELAMWTHMTPFDFVARARFTTAEAQSFCDRVMHAVARAVCPPGESVGQTASECTGEPMTQMTLNTFHFSGIAEKNVTLGLPRIRELSRASAKIATPAMRFVMRALPSETTLEEATHVARSLQGVWLHQVVDRLEAHTGSAWSAAERSAIATLAALDMFGCGDGRDGTAEDTPVACDASVAALRIVLDTENMQMLDMTALDVAVRVSKVIGANSAAKEAGVDDDANDDKVLVACTDGVTVCVEVRGARVDPFVGLCARLGIQVDRHSAVGATAMARKLHQHLMSKLLLRGIPKIRSVNVRQGTMLEAGVDGAGMSCVVERKRYIVTTEGSALAEVLSRDDIAETDTVVSNDVYEVWCVLGIDAASVQLFDEISMTLGFDGSYVHPRHVLMIVHSMMFTGRYISMSAHGISHVEETPTIRACFERPVETLSEAAAHAIVDPMRGVSEAMLLGKVAPIGTGTIDVLPDHKRSLWIGSQPERPPVPTIGAKGTVSSVFPSWAQVESGTTLFVRKPPPRDVSAGVAVVVDDAFLQKFAVTVRQRTSVLVEVPDPTRRNVASSKGTREVGSRFEPLSPVHHGRGGSSSSRDGDVIVSY